MGKKRSMNRKKKRNEARSKNTIKTCDNSSGVASWSDVTHDVLSLVVMKLGVIDFLAFSGVCKSWKSVALSNRNMFMVSKPPMSISFSTNPKKTKCYLEDFKGRQNKINLPHFAAGMRCKGVTGGYLILMDVETTDYSLVNLITMHELHFPNVPDEVICCPGFFRCILVFSPSINEWVFVVLKKCYYEVWFCIAGKQEWTEVPRHGLEVCDLLAFKGKIYTVHHDTDSDEVGICEIRLFPKPNLVLLKTEILKPHFGNPGLVSFAENLYVIDRASEHPYKIHELDFGEMKWVSRTKRGEKYAFFCNDFNDCNTFTLREVWADIHSQYGRYAVHDEKGNGLLFHAKMWYFLDDCLNVDHIYE